MAERRMFSKSVTNDDKFIELKPTAQALYLHLCMASDDDGFCNGLMMCKLKAHANDKDVTSLINAGFIIKFDSGIVVITHWKLSNYIQSDRYNRTIHTEERRYIDIQDKKYILLKKPKKKSDVSKMDTECIHDVSETETQDSIGKVSIDKYSIDKNNSLSKSASVPPSLDDVIAYVTEKDFEYVDPHEYYDYYNSIDWMIGNHKMKNWKSSVSGWERKKKSEGKPKVHQTIKTDNKLVINGREYE